MREMADYDIMWAMSREEFKMFLPQIKDLVEGTLALSQSSNN